MEKGTVKSRKKKITFSLEAPGAEQVHLMGEFNQWKNDIHPMKNDGKGVWTRSVMLPDGTFEYKFLVDGQWMVDPQNARVCPNCFGTLNNVVRVVT